MIEFTFHAPTLFDANPAIAPQDRYHDAPAAAPQNSKWKRLARWLSAELVKAGLKALPPDADEDGWIIPVMVSGGEINLVVYGKRNDETTFVIDVVELGTVPKAAVETIESVLRRAPEIKNLSVAR